MSDVNTERSGPPASLRRPRDRYGVSAPFKSVHHIALVTNDMASTVAFYRDILGSEVAMTHRMPREARERHYFITIADDTVLAVFEFPGAMLPPYMPPTRPKTGRALDHIAFFVEDAAQQLEWHDYLAGKVENLTAILDLDFVTSFFFSDPNGVVLEVMAHKPDVPMDWPLYTDMEPIEGLPAAANPEGGGGVGL